MTRTHKSWLVRGAIVLFWMSVIALFLAMPYLGNIFKQEKSLTVFIWPATLDPKYLQKFEKQTGIKLYFSYFTSNEELYSKVRSTNGQGYDIIFPSDYALQWLLKDELVKKIDKSKLSIKPAFNPELLGRYFDPHNDYSLPYVWFVYGLGVDKDYFGGKFPEQTWGMVFDSQIAPSAVGMSDVPREVFMMAAQYLYGTIESLKDPAKRAVILDMLIKQKKWVEVYNDARPDDLLISHAVPVVVGMSSEIGRVAREDESLGFMIPREGGFLVIDSLAISAASEKDDLIYQFINFLYQEQVTLHHVEKFALFPATDVPIDEEEKKLYPTEKEFRNLLFFRNIIAEDIYNDMWIQLMAY